MFMTEIPKTNNNILDSFLQEKKLEKDHFIPLLNELTKCDALTQEQVLDYLPNICDFKKTTLKKQLNNQKEEKTEKNFSVIRNKNANNDVEEDFEKLRENVLTLTAKGERGEATEEIVKWIEKNKNIYSIRDDENPEMWIYKDGIYVPEAKSYIQEIVRDIVNDAFTTYLTNQVIAKVQSDTFINHDDFFNKKYLNLIPVKNGILNIKTKEIMEFSPEYIFFNKIYARYDPELDCPNIKKFFGEVLASEDDVEIIQELLGYCLYDDYFIEKAFMFYGGGRNGKGKTLSLMKTFLGTDNCTEIPLEDLEKDMYSMADLHGKKANLCGDLSPTALKHTGNFKKLVGKDLITAPRKYLSRIKFVNSAKMIFAANELPMAYDISDAFFNRWIILDFPYQFLPQDEIDKAKPSEREYMKVRDTHIIDKITNEDELSGLLNWAIDGLQKLLKNETFSHSETTQKIRKRWLMRSDSCMAFVMLHIQQDFNSNMSKKEFREFYSRFCKANGLKISGDKRIRAVLETQLGVSDSFETLEDGSRQRVWEGIQLVDMESIDKKIKRVDTDENQTTLQ